MFLSRWQNKKTKTQGKVKSNWVTYLIIKMENNMKNIITNYRTSLFGLISITIGMYIGITSGEWVIPAPMISTGIGLLVASDGAK